MKVREQILYLLTLKGVKSTTARSLADLWLEKFDLTAWAEHKTADLSKGMQQKVQFITTVAHQPRLLILDEPFSGLDPVNTKVIEREIRQLSENGTTIIFSTHRMEQVEELCQDIALINRGRLMLEDEINRVRQTYRSNVYQLEYEGPATALPQLPGLEMLESKAGFARFRLAPELSARDLLASLSDSPLEVLHFSLYLPRLNDIFISLVSGQEPYQAAASPDTPISQNG